MDHKPVVLGGTELELVSRDEGKAASDVEAVLLPGGRRAQEPARICEPRNSRLKTNAASAAQQTHFLSLCLNSSWERAVAAQLAVPRRLLHPESVT